MAMPTPVERRQTPRQELGRIAKIFAGNGASARYCYVINMSEGGIRVTTKYFEVPDEFVLSFPGVGPTEDGRYKVIWRIGNEAGAMRVSNKVEQEIPNSALPHTSNAV
jgi:PilZ domain-containing protein